MKYFIILLSLLISSPLFAIAQAPDLAIERIQDQLKRLEKDMQLMQKELYRSKDQKLSRKEMRTLPSMEVRLSELEEQLRRISGKIEEADFHIGNLTQKLEDVIANIDLRVGTLENNQKHATAGQKTSEEKQPELVSQLEKTSISNQDIALPADQYDMAFKYLRKNEYGKAESALKSFIASNEESELVSNAYYWLGETFYVRGNYEQSAVNFLSGYKKLPKGNKAAENLLKLGMSLGKMNKKKEACTTFKKVISEFPQADADIISKLESEKTLIEC